jgi:hypothetical protein
MTDDDKALVERLRKARVWPDYSQSRVTIETAHEAADRIEELEARYHREQDRIERLIEENARLRGALRDIAEHNVGGKLEFDTPLGMWVGEPAAYAAEAIGEGEIYYRRKVLRND